MEGKLELTPGLVSVVTPVYNGERHLARLLDSVLAQTWDAVQMILVDDGSQDATLDVAAGYAEKFRARGFDYRIVAGEHRNASAAINRGLPWVRGEFLIWPDSDDRLEPDSIRTRLKFLREHPRYQCVRSWMRYLDEEGRPAPAAEPLGDPSCEQLFFSILENQTFVCCGCYMLRTEALFAIYPRRSIPEYDVGQNFQMLLPVLYRCPCATIPQRLYTVYIHPDSHSRRKLTPEQEEQRYAGFEALLDEIAALCGIQDTEELRRLRLWKLRRRYGLALKNRKYLEAVMTWIALRRCQWLPGRVQAPPR